MKKLLLFSTIFLFALSSNLFAQLKIGYVDSDTIISQLPDSKDAQLKIDGLIQEWQEEVDKLEREWKEKYDDYEKRKLVMSDPKRVEVEKELYQMEGKITQYRQAKFGVNGELFKKEAELMKPIQNKVFNAIEEVAKENNLYFVFDRSGDVLFLFAKEEYDITNLVLEKLQ